MLSNLHFDWVKRLLVAALLACAGGLAAHPLPGSSVWLDIGERSVGAELELPLADLEIGFTHDPADPAPIPADPAPMRLGATPLTADPALVLPRMRDPLAAYVARHVRPRSKEGTPWSVQVLTLRVDAPKSQPPMLNVALRLTPAAGAGTDHLVLGYDVITHEVMTHEALVSVRSDWNRGVLPVSPQLVGSIRWMVRSLAIDRPSGNRWNGFIAAVRLGVDHFADGTDHLMFLLTLLLPAPLLLAGRRWGGHAGARATTRQLAGIVSAFTLGHTTMLLAGACGWLALPPQAVEVAIALSIAVSAAHACRPLYPGRETWIAGSFGLVHGAAFATVIAAQGLAGWKAALAIFGFNLGIEAVQLLIVAVALPVLLWLAPLRAYTPLRLTAALVAAVCSAVWLADRLGFSSSQLGNAATWLRSDGLTVISLGAALLAIGLGLRRRRRTGVAGFPNPTAYLNKPRHELGGNTTCSSASRELIENDTAERRGLKVGPSTGTQRREPPAPA